MKRLFLTLAAFLLLFSFQKSEAQEFEVKNYTIRLDLSNLREHRLKAACRLKIVSQTRRLKQVALDLLGLRVDSVFERSRPIENFRYTGKKLHIPLSRKYRRGDTISLRVVYRGAPQIDAYWGGFFFKRNYAFNYGIGMAAKPPNFGRVWFPCIDNFTHRATYDFFIRTKAAHTAAANGTLQSTEKQADGTKISHWKMSNSIPTYLAAVAVGNFYEFRDTIEGKQRPIPVSVFVPPARKEKISGSFANLEKHFQTFEKHFGAYRWEKVGFAGVPFAGGAMEHATLISFPGSSASGTLDSEMLLAHELSHHWFGNLVTCASEADMWLNEGWASYCEALVQEEIYGTQAYKNYVRQNHEHVLRNAHQHDGGYRALYEPPHAYTYGTTIYDKGADVVHTLRGYLGDSLFFSAARQYLCQFAFSHATTENLKNSFEQTTGIALDNFFQTWVYSPGFPHFSVENFETRKAENDFRTKVKIRQRLHHAPALANQNRLEITFLGEKWQKKTEKIVFSGESQNLEFQLGFEPKLIMLDLEEKISDARCDMYKTISQPGLYEFAEAYFVADVKQLSDSAFLRVVHHRVAPVCEQQKDSLRLSAVRYWSVQALLPENFKATANFYFDTREDELFDKRLLDSDEFPARLFFRPPGGKRWREAEFFLQGSPKTGFLGTMLKYGDYAIGKRLK